MDTVLGVIQYVAGPLARAASHLANFLAAMGHNPPNGADFLVAAFAVSVGLVGFFVAYWACWIHVRLDNFRLAVDRDQARAAGAARFCEILLEQSHQAIVVLRSGEQAPKYFADANVTLQDCRSGKDGSVLARALDILVERGTPFQLLVETGSKRPVAIRGLTVGDRAVLYIREEVVGDDGRKFREILNALPMPVRVRGGDIMLEWANGAFLKAVAVPSAQEAPVSKTARGKRGALAAAPNRVSKTASLCVAAQSRPAGLPPIGGARAAAVAAGVTPGAASQADPDMALGTYIDMINRLPLAMAVFDADRNLKNHNRAYRQLWDLDEAWLDRHPSHGEILERLRENRKLPEQRNFAEWSQGQTHPLSSQAGSQEQFWHLPGGKSLRVMTQPHLQGGVFLLFEDISEKLRLTASLNLLTQVQRATLDTIDEGIAIFGTDGRLVLHNALFAKIWLLSESELIGQPHFLDIAGICTARIGHDSIWEIVSCGVNSAQPERFGEWGRAMRADGRSISLSLSRLPNGATAVSFTDITDLEKFESFQLENAHVAA